ncbi:MULTISPECIES: metal ABC transporter permease [Terrabacteria group]|uniref:metal ABC transporter permease n=1 Tax=Bacillati TaxID=1783272 RepID=UPI001C6E56A6|nr:MULTISPECIES: metal ABC transporter permease [Terrabacteria group]MBW9212654.1 metal ABC transporter permease [Trueperella sp. zg.1013]
MLAVLTSYDFLVVAFGTTVLAMVSAVVGCFSVYKGQSLVGDAIGHATFPGIVLTFMLFQTRNPLLLTIGAALSAGLAYEVIQAFVRHSKIQFDAALAIVLSGFFGLGLVLKSYIQGHPSYVNASQAGLKNYIFGLAAFMMKKDVVLIFIVAGVCSLILFLFYKELVLSVFDATYGESIGISSKLVDRILLIMTIALIAVGIKSVGAILISSFLIIPCICAHQHSHRLKNVLMIASGTAGFSAFLGTFLSSLYRGLSTGPTIILVMGTLTFLSMIFGKNSALQKRRSLV